jgi:hypothetical protein
LFETNAPVPYEGFEHLPIGGWRRGGADPRADVDL